MVSENQVREVVDKLNGSEKTLAEFILELYKDKFVELYLGESYEDVSTEQVSTSYPAVLCGKVVSAFKDCLVLKAAFVNNARKTQASDMLFVNAGSIQLLKEINGLGILEDALFRSRESATAKSIVSVHE